ncbi:unnamed protein product [Aureobasidium pullulans]|nr:unnamed protein product [Aureobasidium pullulans]
MLFNIADLLYNIAYSAQFRFWIATFGNLEYFARPNKKVVPTLLAIVIVPALASYFFPKEKKSQGVQPVEEQTSQSTPTGTQKPEIYGGSWSLKNWEKDDQNRAFLVLFVVMISVPLDAAWRILFIPLASLAVVVGHLSLVSLICQIVRKVKKRNSVASKTKASDNISEASVPVDGDSQAIEKQLRERWSPLLRAKDPEWRNVVSSASAVANFSFVCMYYFGIYDASKTVKPALTEERKSRKVPIRELGIKGIDLGRSERCRCEESKPYGGGEARATALIQAEASAPASKKYIEGLRAANSSSCNK